MDSPCELPKFTEIPSGKLNCTLQVVPNRVILSRTQDRERLSTSMAGLLTSLLSDPDLAHRMIGGNLRVQLGDGWVFAGAGTLKRLKIDLILSYEGGDYKNLPDSLKKLI